MIQSTSRDMVAIVTRFQENYGRRFPFSVAKEHEIHIRRFPLPSKIKGMATSMNDIKYVLLNDNLQKNEEIIVASYQVVHHLLGRKFTNYYFSEDAFDATHLEKTTNKI